MRARSTAVLGAGVAASVAAVFACSSESFTGAGRANADGSTPGMTEDGGDAATVAPLDSDAGLDGGVPCGDVVCNEPEICCADPPDANSLGGALTTGPRRCSLREKCPASSVAIACDSPTFCERRIDGGVCCVSHVDARFTSSECVLPPDCDTHGPHDILYVPGGAQCDAGSSCERLSGFSVSFDNYLVCVSR